MLEVKVNPRDVVAVPVDYNNAKMRVCEYVVLSVVTNENTDDALRITNCNTFGQVTEDGRTTEGCCGNCNNCSCCDDECCSEEEEEEDEWEDDEDEYPWDEEDE
jgi:Ran GTPase-activating protein (RanGAP) involved in mRNA processing and transport